MDYEKEYKAALDRARKWYNDSHITNGLRENLKEIFPELKESEDERIKREIIKYIKTGTYRKDWIAWLEKQGEKPQGKSALEAIKEELIDNDIKVEPKLNVGDWVVKKDGNDFCNARKTCRITNIDKEQYWFDSGTWLDAKDIRLWTIKDAEDGDVLASKDGDDILIFRNLDTCTGFSSYYNIKGKGELGWSNDNFFPATKEQSGLLFAMMKEAGYKWDANNKQLIKLL